MKLIRIAIIVMVLSVLVIGYVVSSGEESDPIVTRTSSSETTCNDGICTATLYSGTRFAQNSENQWVDAGDIFSITKFQDDITFHYDGNKGYFNVTFEAGVIHNDNYYSFTDIKGLYPQIEFSFPSWQYPTLKKYAVNISNIPVGVQPGVESVTLTYKDHYGFTLDQLVTAQQRFDIKGIMALRFNDLIEQGNALRINGSERRIYIENLTFVDDSLWLDPTVGYNSTGTSGRISTTGVGDTNWNTVHDATTGSVVTTSPSEAGVACDQFDRYQIYRFYFPFNTSAIPDTATITSADLRLYGFIVRNEDDDDQAYIGVVSAATAGYTLDAADFNDIGTVDNPIVGGKAMLSTLSADVYNTISMNATGYPWINLTNRTLLGLREGHDIEDTPIVCNGVSDNQDQFFFYHKAGDANPPYLNVTYTIPSEGGGPQITIVNVSNAPSTLTNVTVENNFAHLITSKSPPFDSMFFYAPFDVNTSGITHDYTTNNNDGVLMNNPVWIEGDSCIHGGCYDFNGGATGAYIDYDDLGDPTCGVAGLAVMAWVRRTGDSPSDLRVMEYGEDVNNRIWMLSRTDTNQARFRVDTSVGLVTLIGNIGSFPINEWIHFAGVYNSTHMIIYVNGVEDVSSAQTGTVDCVVTDTFEIGRNPDDYGEFSGQLDEVMLFNVSLAPEEILSIVNNQSSKFLPRGTQEFQNNNITNGTFINVTINSSLNFDSAINVTLGDLSGGSYVFGDEFSFTNGIAMNIPISTPTNFSLQFIFYAGNTSVNPFISPTLEYNITIDSNGLFSADSCTCPSSANWNVDCSDNCQSGTCNIGDYNITISGTTGSFSITGNVTTDQFAYQPGCVIDNIPNDGKELRIKT